MIYSRTAFEIGVVVIQKILKMNNNFIPGQY